LKVFFIFSCLQFLVLGPGIIPTAQIGVGQVSLAICQDFDFPRYIATAPKSDVLLEPSETWGHIGKYHAEVNGVRAIEQGEEE
jgi:predicted amidohydrolase